MTRKLYSDGSGAKPVSSRIRTTCAVPGGSAGSTKPAGVPPRERFVQEAWTHCAVIVTGVAGPGPPSGA